MSAQQFEDDMQRWANLQEQQLLALARQSTQEIYTRISTNTRIGVTRFLSASWQPSFGAPAPGPRTLEQAGSVDAMDTADVGIMLSRLTLGQTFYATNNAAYALRIEYGFVGLDSLGRYYNQKGDYNVTTHVAMWPMIVEQTARELGFT
jgi:hypothetical protein